MIMFILSLFSLAGGLAAGACCCGAYTKSWAEGAKPCTLAAGRLCALTVGIGATLALLWCLLTPPPFSVEIDGPPEHHLRNDPSASVYLGNGCFWHTQYDFVLVEQEDGGAFGSRNDSDVTSLVGYAGGRHQASNGAVCYHGVPATDYGRLGHSEAVSVQLDAGNRTKAIAQLAAVAKVYFEHGFQDHDGKRQRLDPQDAGPEYRNVIGLPGGKANTEWWPVIEAANIYNMPLLDGRGGNRGDTQDEYVVYIYDSSEFPFFRAEAYHQFHPNDVIRRPVPSSYTIELKQRQREAGRLDDDPGCAQLPFGELVVFIVFACAALLGCSLSALYWSLPGRLRPLDRCSGESRETSRDAISRFPEA